MRGILICASLRPLSSLIQVVSYQHISLLQLPGLLHYLLLVYIAYVSTNNSPPSQWQILYVHGTTSDPPGEFRALQRTPEKLMSLTQSAVTLMDVSSAQKNWVFAQYVYPSLCSRGWTLMVMCSFMVGNTYVRLWFHHRCLPT